VAGGAIGALVGAGIPEQNARAYEEALRNGGVAVGVVPRSSSEAGAIQKRFSELNGENVCYC
jgi:GTP-sensing pleiotropic transcriptional regulator CodY